MGSSIRVLFKHSSYVLMAICIYLLVVYISSSPTISYFAGLLVASPFLISMLAGEKINAMSLVKNYFSIKCLSFCIVMCIPFVIFILAYGLIVLLINNAFISGIISIFIFSSVYNTISQFLHKIATGKEYLETSFIDIVNIAVFMGLSCLALYSERFIPQSNWIVGLCVSVLTSALHIVFLFLMTAVIVTEESK